MGSDTMNETRRQLKVAFSSYLIALCETTEYKLRQAKFITARDRLVGKQLTTLNAYEKMCAVEVPFSATTPFFIAMCILPVSSFAMSHTSDGTRG